MSYIMTIGSWMVSVLASSITVGSVIGAIALTWWFVAWVVYRALNQTLCIAAIIEAAVEARKQGRAPILKAWRWVGGKS